MSWVLVVIFFLGNEPVDSAILKAKDEAECRAGIKKAEEIAKANGVEAWGKCIPLDRDPKKTVYKIERNT